MPSLVTICKDGDDLAARAADLVIRAVQAAIRARGRAMLALAGGATPKATYGLLAQPARRSRIEWARTYLFFGDERFVSPDDPSSN
ncbi:MAG: 6-phosphogluconolactonase, partial [Thermoanaerobaculaceae bacterium]|nr:6-phosphogluconolactonase [Thermoanaerobaculaceae bacterium]